jgi:laminin G domain protein
VTLNGANFEFPGWKNNVDATGHITGTISDANGKVTVSDTNHNLEPINGALSVEGTIRLRLTSAGTLPVSAGQGTSFNLVQKARASNTQGFWKVEIRGNGRGMGHPHCTIGDGRVVVVAESTVRVDNGAWHTFACRLNKGVLAMTVDGVTVTTDARSLGPVNPIERFSTEVVIGKKPGSTDPFDSFSGWVDQLNISAG